MYISSSYAKILGETNFPKREIPRSGSKAEDGEEKKRERGAKVGENNGQATHGARKHAWRTQAAWAKKETVSFDQAFGPGEKKTVGEGGVFTSDFIKELPNFTVVSVKTGL